MSIEMFLKFVAILLFASLILYTNIKAGQQWLKLFSITLFVISVLYATYFLIIS